ncbi:MAG TPA: hypothetical protein VMT16_15800 [Thermoanaerobaculia bacterium]|nr:hypothetical protein [Thermoanaerobaculia bacterium]
MQTILVVGDLLWDHDLVSHPGAPGGHHGAPPRTVLRRRAGGAWFLADLAGLACADREVAVRALRRTRGGGRAHTLWSLFPRHGDEPRGVAAAVAIHAQLAPYGVPVVVRLAEDAAARLNPSLVPWEMLASDDQEVDRALVREIPRALAELGFALRRRSVPR